MYGRQAIAIGIVLNLNGLVAQESRSLVWCAGLNR